MSGGDRNLRFRDAEPGDGAAVAEIYNESIDAGDSTMDDGKKSSSEMADLITGFGPRETILLLENVDELEVLGWGIIKRYSDRSGYRFCCETSVYLRRHLVGLGLGPRIKQALIDRCGEYGYHHLVAKIFADNERSIEYNRRFGYEMVGIQREIGFKNGHWQDIAILQLVLPQVETRPDTSAHSKAEEKDK